jgi:tetratricopeptide (TPR) repeat protein
VNAAKEAKKEEWIGRILVDSLLGHADPGHEEFKELLKAAKGEKRGGRFRSAAHIAMRVWEWSMQNNVAEPGQTRVAESLLRQLLDQLEPHEAIEHLKQKYAVHLGAGEPWNAIESLVMCADYARSASLWEEYAAAVDQQAVTLQELGHPDVAEPLHRDAFRVAVRHRLRERERTAAANLAECLRRRGQLKNAYRISQKAMSLYHCDEDPAGYTSALHNHYLIERALGRPSASKTLRRCMMLARRHELVDETIRATMAQANEAWDRSNWKRAEAGFRNALKLAERAQLPAAIAGCRYNLALVLRRNGRVREAVRVLLKIPAQQEIDVDLMHRISLLAILLEEDGRVGDAARAWQHAAQVAHGLEEAFHATYYQTRAHLIETCDLEKQDSADVLSRADIADRASGLLSALYKASRHDAEIQGRYDAIESFAREKDLVHYRVHALRALADVLLARRHRGDVEEAARASVASILLAAGADRDARTLRIATQAHVGWLGRLALSRSKLLGLKARVRVWLVESIKMSDKPKLLDSLLSGFDMATKPIAAGQ